ncbi:MAG: hypothetical protein ACPG31_01445 [Planctomycetota bacterium]
MLLLVGLVLTLCVGVGFALRTFRMAPVAQPEVIEMLIPDEIALMHEVAAALAASEIAYPAFDHDAGFEEYQRLQEKFLEELNRITAPAEAIEHPGIVGIKVKLKGRHQTNLEAWVISPAGGTDIYGFTRFSHHRPEPGKAVVAHANVDGNATAAYRAVGETQNGLTPTFELLVDVAWLESQASAEQAAVR